MTNSFFCDWHSEDFDFVLLPSADERQDHDLQLEKVNDSKRLFYATNSIATQLNFIEQLIQPSAQGNERRLKEILVLFEWIFERTINERMQKFLATFDLFAKQVLWARKNPFFHVCLLLLQCVKRWKNERKVHLLQQYFICLEQVHCLYSSNLKENKLGPKFIQYVSLWKQERKKIASRTKDLHLQFESLLECMQKCEKLLQVILNAEQFNNQKTNVEVLPLVGVTCTGYKLEVEVDTVLKAHKYDAFLLAELEMERNLLQKKAKAIQTSITHHKLNLSPNQKQAIAEAKNLLQRTTIEDENEDLLELVPIPPSTPANE